MAYNSPDDRALFPKPAYRRWNQGSLYTQSSNKEHQYLELSHQPDRPFFVSIQGLHHVS